MACRFEITLAGEDAAFVPAARTALDEIDRLEDELSVFRETSTISHVNQRAACQPVAVRPQPDGPAGGLPASSSRARGAFDITSTPLSRCWGFLRREGRVPDADAIEAARRLVGFDAVQLDREAGTVRLACEGAELNLGAIGQGYALDRVSSGLRASGVGHALLSAGRSSLLAIGGRGDGWRIDRLAAHRRRTLAGLELRDAALGTSGAGEQFVVADGAATVMSSIRGPAGPPTASSAQASSPRMPRARMPSRQRFSWAGSILRGGTALITATCSRSSRRIDAPDAPSSSAATRAYG